MINKIIRAKGKRKVNINNRIINAENYHNILALLQREMKEKH